MAAPVAPPSAVAAAPVAAPAAAPTPAGTVGAASPEAEAAQLFSVRCSVCHGAQGLGDGIGAAALNPKPANFTSPEWQSAVTDQHIEKIILEGGAAVGKSATMPPNPDLTSKPEVIAALRAHIRSLKRAP